MISYDYRGFHPNCPGVHVVSGPSGLCVVCPDCRVAADMEGVSGKVSVADACKEGKGIQRQLIGKMTKEISWEERP